MERRWLKWVVVGSLLLFLLGCSIIGFDLHRLFYRPMVVESSKANIIRIERPTTASSFAHLLYKRHFIASERWFLLLIRIQGLSSQLKAGVYEIKPGETALQFLYRVVSGDVLMLSFRITEGTTLQQVTEGLNHADDLVYQAADWLPIVGSHSSAEGLLLADTYYYHPGSQAKVVLALANRNLMQYLEYSWQQRCSDLPYRTSYELLIVASILEKEAALPEEKRLISGVIFNRLRKGMPLQMDPTVIYALGAGHQGALVREDLSIDSPYNSYRYKGLPPTPIAMVGKDAIFAAAHPMKTDYLYFVARGDGTHQFSKTYEEQRQAIARYLKKET